MGEHLVSVITTPKGKSRVFQHKVEHLSQLGLTSIGVDYTASYQESPNLRPFTDNLRGADHLILEGPESRMRFLTIETLVQSYEALTYNLHENDDPNSNFWINLSRKGFKPLSRKEFRPEDFLKPEDFASFRNSRIHYLTYGFDFIELGERYGLSKEQFTAYYMLTIFNSIHMVEEKAKINDPVKIAHLISNFSEKNTFKTVLALLLNQIPGWNGKPTVDETADRLKELLCEKENETEEILRKRNEELITKCFTQYFFRDIKNYEMVGPRMKELVPSLDGKKVAVLGLANLDYSILSLLKEQMGRPKQWEEVIQNLPEEEQEQVCSIENKLFPLEKKLISLNLRKISPLRLD